MSKYLHTARTMALNDMAVLRPIPVVLTYLVAVSLCNYYNNTIAEITYFLLFIVVVKVLDINDQYKNISVAISTYFL